MIFRPGLMTNHLCSSLSEMVGLYRCHGKVADTELSRTQKVDEKPQNGQREGEKSSRGLDALDG